MGNFSKIWYLALQKIEVTLKNTITRVQKENEKIIR